MDNNTQPTQPEQPQGNPPQEGSVGPIIATIIILAVIVLGGLYFWGQRASNSTDQETATSTVEGADVSSIEEQNNSDDASSIEADLNSTNIDELDAEIQAS